MSESELQRTLTPQEVMDRQGYIILAFADEPKVGMVVEDFLTRYGSDDHCGAAVVVCMSSREEWAAQSAWSDRKGRAEWIPDAYKYFAKVIAE